MPLSERHGTGVEPYVGQLRNAAHFTAARTFERHFIDVGAVQVQQVCAFSAQLLDAADGPLFFAPLAHPNRQPRSPIAIACKSPVFVLFEPDSESAFTRFRRIPMTLL